MKKVLCLGVVFMCGIILVGCGNKADNSTIDSKTVESSISLKSSSESITTDSNTKETSNDNATSTDIVASGEYIVGEDIKPGKYYLVLDNIEYAPEDSDHQGYINFDQYRNNGEKKENISGESFINKVGKKFRVNLKDGDILEFSDNYSPEWTVKLLNDDDFKKYTEESKYD